MVKRISGSWQRQMAILIVDVIAYRIEANKVSANRERNGMTR